MQLIVQVRGKTAIGRVTDHLVYRRPDGKERSGLVDEGRRVVGVARVLDGECFTNPEDHPAELDVPDSGQMPGIAMEVSRLVTEAVPVTSDRLDVHRPPLDWMRYKQSASWLGGLPRLCSRVSALPLRFLKRP